MQKRLNFVFMTFYFIGLVSWLIRSFLRNSLSDFSAGFLDGMSIVMFTAGFIYICWCFGHGKNPFKYHSEEEK